MDKQREKSSKELKNVPRQKYTEIHSEQYSEKSLIWKTLAIIAYMHSGFKNSLPSMTDWLSKEIEDLKKQTHPDGWSKERPSW